VRTLPVILGEAPAKVIASALMIVFYPIVIGAAAFTRAGPADCSSLA
jgi:1,4-dihydroxy-2-naphthoate octaprenyltransferase